MLTMGEFVILDRHNKIKNQFQRNLNYTQNELLAVNAQKNAALSYITELECAVQELSEVNHQLSHQLEKAESDLADSDALITSLEKLLN